jgi:(E)-4-hydroxy-3-methylbut-2-enyl-diphosphate synthase
VNALEQRLEDIVTPLDVSIIGCVVNGPGEAEVSDIGLTGARNMSGFYEDGVRQRERLANNELVDKLEQKIRAKVAAKNAMMDDKNRIDVSVSQ